MIAAAAPSRVQESSHSCLLVLHVGIRSLALTFPIRPSWPTNDSPTANSVGDETRSRVAACERRWFALRAAADADLVHRVEHRHPCGQLEFAGEDGRLRRVAVVPLLQECQAVRDMLLCEAFRRSNFRRLLFDSPEVVVHSVRVNGKDQAGRMLLPEEARPNGSRLETQSESARRSPRVEIMRLRTDRFPDAARQHRASNSDEGILAERPRRTQRFRSRSRCLSLRPAVSTARPPSEVSARRLTS